MSDPKNNSLLAAVKQAQETMEPFIPSMYAVLDRMNAGGVKPPVLFVGTDQVLVHHLLNHGMPA